MIGDAHRLTPGYVARHLPRTSRVGPDIALLDIAQDFLLAHLAEAGVFELVVFKGGTALRKLFVGGQGRFSTDIDLAARAFEPADRRELTALVASYCTTALGPFQFTAAPQRDRYTIAVQTTLGDVTQAIKLEIGPPCWQTPVDRPFVPHPTHACYGFFLPALPCMTLEEIMAEKIARLTRQATARDAFDLIWLATTSPYSQYNRALVRRLAMLKVWVDHHGLGDTWRPALHPRAFKAAQWLGDRGAAWDDEQIGRLAHPPPTLAQLTAQLQQHYGWLRDPSPEEARWAAADRRDRGSILQALRTLPASTLADAPLR